MGIKTNRRFARMMRTNPAGEPSAGTGAGGGGTGGAPAPANPAGSAGATNPAGDGWIPPTREEFEALQKRHTKTIAEATRWRMRAKGRTDDAEQFEEKKGLDKPTAPKPAAPAANTGEIAQLRRVAINAAIRSDLTAAGFQNPTKDRIARALRMIDSSAIDLDADGDVDGLDEQIELLKEEFPEFFTAGKNEEQRSPRVRAPRVSTGGKAPVDTGSDNDQHFARTKTSASRWADIALGKVDQ